jgi:beta-phosphoglucomutase-like phosphatase (HAD superfamily)
VIESEHPFESGRARPIVTSLDMLRARIDIDAFDAVILALKAVAADLGYGDIRPLPGSVAWIDRMRGTGKRVAVASDAERAESALEIAQIADRIDLVVSGPPLKELTTRVLDELAIAPDRVIAVAVESDDIESARNAGIEFVIAIARGASTPDQLRRAGATTVVADLQELVGLTGG